MLKVSVYDSLSMVATGYLLLLLFVPELDLSEKTVLVFIACYVVGLVYHKIMERLLKSLRNPMCLLKKSYQKVDKEFDIKDTIAPSEKDYYGAYYLLMKRQCLNSIPVLEGQEAFVRNIIPILVVYVLQLCCCHSSLENLFGNLWGMGCCPAGVILLIVIALLVIWYSLKLKIHKLVWEGAYFLKRDEKVNS